MKLQKLEAIRGFAAFYVVLHHLYAGGIDIAGINFTALFKFGQEAVIVFFILSGFVIQYSFAKSKDQSFKTYFQKRFYRIFIPLILVVVANLLFNWWMSGTLPIIPLSQIIGNVFMLQDLGNKYNTIVLPILDNEPLWSLSYEWWFYLLFFSFYKYKINNHYTIGVLALIAAIAYSFLPIFPFKILMYLGIWWVGVILAEQYSIAGSFNQIKFQPILKYLGFIVGIAVVLIFNANIKLEESLATPGVLSGSPVIEPRHFFCCILLVLVLLVWKKINFYGIQILKPFYYLAPISFTLYISHWFLVVQARYVDNYVANIHLSNFIYIIVCFVFCWIIEVKFYPIILKLLKK